MRGSGDNGSEPGATTRQHSPTRNREQEMGFGAFFEGARDGRAFGARGWFGESEQRERDGSILGTGIVPVSSAWDK